MEGELPGWKYIQYRAEKLLRVDRFAGRIASSRLRKMCRMRHCTLKGHKMVSTGNAPVMTGILLLTIVRAANQPVIAACAARRIQ